jgi:putative endonuclease
MPFDAQFEGFERPVEGTSRKALRGLRAYQSGLAGEACVEQSYLARGYDVAARRWRGACGEIDLIFEKDGGYVMVEVKCSTSHEMALSKITAQQMGRVASSSLDFLGKHDLPLETDLRIDVALVDGFGQVETMENVSLH